MMAADLKQPMMKRRQAARVTENWGTNHEEKLSSISNMPFQ